MKQKRLPEDFQVEELTDFRASQGPYALYRLTKRGMGTLEAVQALRKRWRLMPGQMSSGGLKDRHAVTTQWITIRNGPRRNLKQTNLDVVYEGQADRPFEPRDIAGNRFHLVLRGLSDGEAAHACQALIEIERYGLPNYFNQQRFGSVGRSGDFIARAWCAEEYEQAIWLVLADANPHDRSGMRAEREVVRRHWGDWARCRSRLHRSPWLEIVDYLLHHPADFGGAAERIRPDLRSLYVAAFQSLLWNQMLATFLREHLRPEQLAGASIAGRSIALYGPLDPEQRAAISAARLPLPSARLKVGAGPLKALIDEVVAPFGLTLDKLRIKRPRQTFFSKGDRPAVFFARDLVQEIGPDELYSGRSKLTLHFRLPRGSYATVLIKRLAL